jgi:hypothetical protein
MKPMSINTLLIIFITCLISLCISCTRPISTTTEAYTPTEQEFTALRTIETILITTPEQISTFFPWQSNSQGIYSASFAMSSTIGTLTGIYQLNYLDKNQDPIIDQFSLHPSTLVTPNTTHYSIEDYSASLGNILINNLTTKFHQYSTSNNTITYDLEKTISLSSTWTVLDNDNITFELNGSESIISNKNSLTSDQSYTEQISHSITLTINSDIYTGTFIGLYKTSLYLESSLIDIITATIQKSGQSIGILSWDLTNNSIEILKTDGSTLE